jgi:DNA-binding MarR family transcriptional regulator
LLKRLCKARKRCGPTKILDYVNDIGYFLGMKKHPLAPDFLELPHSGQESHLFREIMLTYQAMMSQFSRSLGMNAARFGLLRTIARNPGEAIGPMEIARRLGINASAVTRQIKDLEKERLLIRQDDPQDARRSAVVLTAAGRAKFLEIHKRVHEFEAALALKLSRQELAVAEKVLGQVREALTK